ncbi:hypothetical protein DMB42_47075 [Nonomuraea sp. WAC 01424]|nr:hypothetical protein DMB42_47075 [Nonomuraea sp. WAC 01424]
MSEEQRIIVEFGEAATRLRQDLSEVPESVRPFTALIDSIINFGTCELRMRRADRLQALGERDVEAAWLVESALAHHERGLQALPAVRLRHWARLACSDDDCQRM